MRIGRQQAADRRDAITSDRCISLILHACSRSVRDVVADNGSDEDREKVAAPRIRQRVMAGRAFTLKFESKSRITWLRAIVARASIESTRVRHMRIRHIPPPVPLFRSRAGHVAGGVVVRIVVITDVFTMLANKKMHCLYRMFPGNAPSSRARHLRQDWSVLRCGNVHARQSRDVSLEASVK